MVCSCLFSALFSFWQQKGGEIDSRAYYEQEMLEARKRPRQLQKRLVLLQRELEKPWI
jgi:hypothetical protein